jgi:two-component system response regulator QseB
VVAKVLVVEDDPRIASMMAKGLRAKGLEVETVATGADALERVGGGGIDLQLLDLGLPDMDGLEVLERLRERGTGIPVIVITARSDPSHREAAVGFGVADYLIKPFGWEQLWAAIERCL